MAGRRGLSPARFATYSSRAEFCTPRAQSCCAMFAVPLDMGWRILYSGLFPTVETPDFQSMSCSQRWEVHMAPIVANSLWNGTLEGRVSAGVFFFLKHFSYVEYRLQTKAESRTLNPIPCKGRFPGPTWCMLATTEAYIQHAHGSVRNVTEPFPARCWVAAL